MLIAYQLGEGIHWYLVLFFIVYKQLNLVKKKKKKKFSSPVFSLKASCFLLGNSFQECSDFFVLLYRVNHNPSRIEIFLGPVRIC